MTDPLQPDTRPFFMDVWREHRFRVDIVAKEAAVPEGTVHGYAPSSSGGLGKKYKRFLQPSAISTAVSTHWKRFV